MINPLTWNAIGLWIKKDNLIRVHDNVKMMTEINNFRKCKRLQTSAPFCRKMKIKGYQKVKLKQSQKDLPPTGDDIIHPSFTYSGKL